MCEAKKTWQLLAESGTGRHIIMMHFGKGDKPNLMALYNDVLIIAGLVAYWPARIHDVALLDLYCPHVTSGRLAVCYSV